MRTLTIKPNPFVDLHQVLPDFDSLAEVFHENTKIVRLYPPELTPGTPFSTEEALQPGLEQVQLMQKPYKAYETVPQTRLPAIADLPPLEAKLQSTIWKRRTARNFKSVNLNLEQISQLLNLSYGITYSTLNMKTRGVQSFRAVPSGGALYPLELYVVPLRPVEGLGDGLYHFNIKANTLEQLRGGNVFPELYDVTMRNQPNYLQHILGEGALAVVITGVFSRTLGKYGNRGYRYVMFEAGHVMQNLLLAAVASGLQAFESAAFDDDLLSDFLGIHGVEEAPLYYGIIGG